MQNDVERCEDCGETVWFCFCDIECRNCKYWPDEEKPNCGCQDNNQECGDND